MPSSRQFGCGARRRLGAWFGAAAIAAAAGAALLAGVAAPAAPPPAPAFPLVGLRCAPESFAAWFPTGSRGRQQRPLECRVTDERGVPIAGKAELRGFSRWHHTAAKPALRVELKAREVPSGFDEFELTRPEDVLALGNWLPEQLALELGLITSGSEHVGLQIDGADFGVYLRSLRPGPLLAQRSGRAPGTFCKGDAIGERVGSKLWQQAAAWRCYGDGEAAARTALQALLDALAAAPAAAPLQAVARLCDAEASARAAAVLALTGSVHTDAIHNHMLFFRPARGDFEVVPWDCNSFGTHAAPDVPVDVVQHPLAAAWSRDPRWVHRRNAALWQLLHGSGSAAALAGAADRLLQRIGPALQRDPALGWLRFHDGGFTFASASGAELPAFRQRFGDWVREREQWLRRWFDGAAVAVSAHPDRAGWSLVEVHGHVGVVAAAADGLPLGGPLQAEELLLPGLAAELAEAPQRHGAGKPLLVPFAPPAALRYELPRPPAGLRFRNAFTGASVVPTAAPATAARSVHPWQLEPPDARCVRLGPGTVEVRQSLLVPAGGRLEVAPGTTLRLGAGVGILCLGACALAGTAAAPIRLLPAGDAACGGLAIAGTVGDCVLTHVELQGGGAWTFGSMRFPALLTLRDRSPVQLEAIACSDAAGVGIAVDGARVALQDCRVRDCSDRGLDATAARLDGAGLQLRRCGGAALALWHSDAALRAVAIADTPSAGVQLGGRSRLRLLDSSLGVCRAGVQCGEESLALLEDCVLRLVHTGWSSPPPALPYRDAGTGCLVRCRFEQIGAVEADVASGRLLAIATAVLPSSASGDRVRIADELPPEAAALAEPPR